MSAEQAVTTEVSKLYPHHDEVDLADLLHGLWEGRYLIASAVILCLLLAGGYLLTSKPVYEARGLYTPPSQQQLVHLLPQPISGFSLDRNSLFLEFQTQLRSNQVQKQFFNDVVWSEGLDEAGSRQRLEGFGRFIQKLTIKLPTAKDTERYVEVTLRGDSPEQTVQWLNQYVAFANEATLKYLGEEFEAVRLGQIETLEHRIEHLKFEFDQRKEQRIGQLQAALAIAQSLGIEENRVGEAVVANVAGQGGQKGINLVEPPLYMFGSRELKAQVESLVKSKGTYFEIGSLPSLERQLLELKQARFEAKGVRAYREQDRPMPVYTPVSPKTTLVLALAGVAGLMLGAFAVLVRAAMRRPRPVALS